MNDPANEFKSGLTCGILIVVGVVSLCAFIHYLNTP
jgi:hypothetical protein